MSYQPEPQETAYPDVQPPSQPYQYPNQPQPQPTLDQYYPPQGQYPGQNPPQYYPPQPQPGTAQWGPSLPAQYPPQQQGQQSTSVVVVSAQPTIPTVVVTRQPRDYLILSVVSIILCAFFGLLVGMLCPVPALIFSLKASSANKSGDHETAKKFGRASLGWNIGVYIVYAILTIIWVAVVASRCTLIFGRLFCI